MNRQYHVIDRFMIRTPALPFQTISEVMDIVSDLEKFQNLIEDLDIREALFIASPSLLNELDKMSSNHQADSAKTYGLAQTIIKYILRMSTRPTPFGLFAGVFIGEFGNSTDIKLNRTKATRRTRLSFDILARLNESIVSKDDIRPKLCYHINTSLYAIGEDYRYIRTNFKNDTKTYSLQQIKSSENLHEILSLLRETSSFSQVLDAMESMGYDKKEAKDYMNSLIDAQILLPETQPYTVGNPYLESMIKTLEKRIGNGHKVVKELKKLNYSVEGLDSNGVKLIDSYKKVTENLSAIIESKTLGLFQTDLFFNGQAATLNRKEKNIITRGLHVLQKICLRRNTDKLDRFKLEFLEQYAGNPVKLVEVLDVDSGLGYPLLRKSDNYWYLSDLNLAYSDGKEELSSISNIDKILKNKIALLGNSQILELDDNDLSSLPEEDIKMPASFHALTERYVMNGKPSFFMPGIGGATGIALMGRFSGHDNDIDKMIEDIAEIEQEYYKGAICAEIDHVPEERTGNILFRKNLRDAVIPFLSCRQTSLTKNIQLNDIYLSIKGNELVLTNGADGQRIIPFLSNAHNYKKSLLPIYLFLCDLQFSNSKSFIRFDWGNLGKTRVFLPRVNYKNVILSKAKWLFNQYLLNKFFTESTDIIKYSLQMEEFISYWKIPQLVFLTQGDNHLFLDLHSITGIKLFKSITKNLDKIILEEFIQSDEYSITNEKNGGHLNQMLFCFKTVTHQ